MKTQVFKEKTMISRRQTAVPLIWVGAKTEIPAYLAKEMK
jgi:hypothetical protein